MTTASKQPLSAADRLKKLRAMSADEIYTRLRYNAYCRLERARHARAQLAHGNDLRRALVPALAQRPDWRAALVASRMRRQPRFFAGAEQLATTRRLFVERYTDERERARREADRAARHEFSFFGGTYLYGEQVDWHADPVTKAQWPQRYHRDVPVHGGDLGFGDVKHVWELGRHQFLIDLAKGWAIERDPLYAARLRALVSDWRKHNPVGTGVAWSCALEPAFRSLSWLWAYYLTLDDERFDETSHLAWIEGFHEHGWFLYRHLEYYTSPFNHLIGEACALFCLGLLFPEFKEAARWRAHARHVLESRLDQQFYADGGSVEQSTFYHHATTGFYLLSALLGRLNGVPLSERVWSALERALDFSAMLRQPDGTTPRIGGADDGKPIRLEQLPLWDFRPYQAIGTVLFDRPDFKAAAGRFHEDALWLLGGEGLSRFESLPSSPEAPASRVFEASGYAVLRRDWSGNADYVCFDCGEQAAGLRRDAIPSAAHGHADALSVIVWRRGRPVLVDPGFFCYNGPKAWQDHFRETAAHNTIRIDGRDQAQHINKMAWSHTYTVTLEGHDIRGSAPWAVASHDGYRRLGRGDVRHRRVVWSRRRYVLLYDLIDGSGEHLVEATFQFAPGHLSLGAGRASFEEVAAVSWYSPVPLRAEAYDGGPLPADGWIAPSLGVKIGAPRLVLTGRVQLPFTLVTAIGDDDVGLGRPDTNSALEVRGTGWIEWLAGRHLPDRSTLELKSDALLAAWSRDGDRLLEDGCIDGTFQSHSRGTPAP